MPLPGKTVKETSGLLDLSTMFPWPESTPAAIPDSSGWFYTENQRFLSRCISDDIRVIVELGTWLGKSTRWFCKSFPRATVICVDHWKGSVEHHRNKKQRLKLPLLYETFIATNFRHRDQIIPVRLRTIDGMVLSRVKGVVADLVYVDAAHDPSFAVAKDIDTAIELWPQARIVGDDWPHPPVREAVRTMAKKHGRKICRQGRCWELSQGG